MKLIDAIKDHRFKRQYRHRLVGRQGTEYRIQVYSAKNPKFTGDVRKDSLRIPKFIWDRLR